MALQKTPFFYKLINKAMDSFGEKHHLTARQYFAPLLGFNGDNASIMLASSLNYTTYNPALPKPLSVDQLKVLLDELGEDRNIIIDGILREYELIAVPRVDAHSNITNINVLTDCANIKSADVFRVVKSALSDGITTSDEKRSILKEIEEADRANAELRDLLLHLDVK